MNKTIHFLLLVLLGLSTVHAMEPDEGGIGGTGIQETLEQRPGIFEGPELPELAQPPELPELDDMEGLESLDNLDVGTDSVDVPEGSEPPTLPSGP